MAAALLEHRLRARGVDDLQVGSAGVLRDGQPANLQSVTAMQRRGLDLTAHRSRRLEPSFVVGADLVLGMERGQVREAILAAPEAWSRCFTLKELVRRAGAVGPRPPDESLRAWLEQVHAGRERSTLLGFDAADDVADPVGGSPDDFEHTATELEALLDRVVALGWGQAA